MKCNHCHDSGFTVDTRFAEVTLSYHIVGTACSRCPAGRAMTREQLRDAIEGAKRRAQGGVLALDDEVMRAEAERLGATPFGALGRRETLAETLVGLFPLADWPAPAKYAEVRDGALVFWTRDPADGGQEWDAHASLTQGVDLSRFEGQRCKRSEFLAATIGERCT